MSATSQRSRRPPPAPPPDRGDGWLVALLAPLLLSLVVVGIALAAAAYGYETTYAERIYPGVRSQGVELGGYTPAEARDVLAAAARRLTRAPVVLRYQGREWRPRPEELGLRLELEDTVEAAYAVGREGDLPARLAAQVAALRSGHPVGSPRVAGDPARQSAYLAALARELYQPPVDAQLVVQPGGQVLLQRARPGRRLDLEATAGRLAAAAAGLSPAGAATGPPPDFFRDLGAASPAGPLPVPVVELVVAEVRPAVVEDDLAPLAEQARRALGAPLTLRLGGQRWDLDLSQVQALVALREAPGTRRPELVVDEPALRRRLEEIGREVARPARNARFDYAGGQLRAIAPGAPGRRLDLPAALAAVRASLLAGPAVGPARSVELPLVEVLPAIGAADGAKLGIRELIEQASTDYNVGTAERRFNVELAAQRLHGVVVAPGEVFSFNDEVGEVSYRSGYKQGYGITQGGDGEVQTIPSEGGGICQVATTLFHAVFWAGYEVVERNWHLYWIPRYGQPPRGLQGLDATIDQAYDRQGNLVSAVDFRFRNDSQSWVLVQARYDQKRLTFQLYGVRPGWQVKVEPPKIEKVVKADPAPVRQLDRSLAPGSELQIEAAQDGFQATIVRTVLQPGPGGPKVLEQRSFVSVYRPSRNVLLSGPR